MKPQKIGILTFHRAINYGAIWQCYALTNYLKAKGFEVSVLDYFPEFLRKYHYRLPKNPYNFIIKLLVIPRFRRFVRKNLPLTQTFFNKNEIKQISSEFDVFICGSDQIWNKELVGNELSVFLLDFVNEGKLKIAYSASIGGKSINKEDYNSFIENLKSFSAISVREILAREEIYKLTGVRPQIVLDPTLLMDKDFYLKQISDRFKRKNYILVIDLEKNNLLQYCAKRIEQETKLPIINVSSAYYKYATNTFSVSPSDWVGAIYYAKYLVVNSFHGLAFSILFEKNFYFVNKKKKSGNNRALDLLQVLGLSDRFIEDVESIDINKKVDYLSANNALTHARELSGIFLNTVLK